jgi:hypothetical protein
VALMKMKCNALETSQLMVDIIPRHSQCAPPRLPLALLQFNVSIPIPNSKGTSNYPLQDPCRAPHPRPRITTHYQATDTNTYNHLRYCHARWRVRGRTGGWMLILFISLGSLAVAAGRGGFAGVEVEAGVEEGLCGSWKRRP